MEWTRISKENGERTQVDEKTVRQRLDGWVKSVDEAIRIGYGETCSFVYQKEAAGSR